ncbi:MAG TPA: phosphatase PAP2 family protein [Gemmatimonadales bacterium]|nr:phosphatase PAP2 family protein [Gemmatimonadales bacterium]
MAVASGAQESVALAIRRRLPLRAVDLLLLAYLAFTSLVALARADAMRGWRWLLAANGLTAVLILLLARSKLGRFGRTLREIYPLLLLASLYGALDLLSSAGGVVVYDAAVRGWEAVLFGGQPSRDWWQRSPSAFWSTVLHGAYFSYYVIVATPPLVLLVRRDLPGLRRFVLAVMATFVFCYVWFVLYPVAGPYYEFPRPTGVFVDNAMARLVYATLAAGSSYGAAFPSSHVAASVAATITAWRASRRLGLALIPPTALLTVGVVYCQMHYAVDAVAGLVVGAAIAALVSARR